MTPLLGLVLIVVIAFLGSYFAVRLNISSVWLRAISFSGIFYILLGFVIGPSVLRVLSQVVVQNLNVLFSLVLGWVGFLIGIQVSIKGLRRFPRVYFFNSAIIYLFIFFSLSALVYYLCTFIPALNISWYESTLLSLAGAVTSPILIGVIVRDYHVKGKAAHWLQFNAAFDNLLGVITIGILFLVSHVTHSFNNGQEEGAFLFFMPVAITLVSIFLYQFLYNELKGEQERFLLFIALLLMAIGSAYYFKQSILFNSFLFGLGLANSKIDTRKLFQSIQFAEKPLYVILLVYAGLAIEIRNVVLAFIVAAIFIGVRMFIKLLSGVHSLGGIREDASLSRNYGLANLGMGGLSLAIILDYLTLNPAEVGRLFLIVVVVAILVNDLISLHYLQKHIAGPKR